MPFEGENIIYIGDKEINAASFYLGDGQIALNPFTFDTNTQIFVSQSRITSPYLIGSLNEMVVGLKEKNLWNKMYALYPFVGSDANTSKYNLINTATYELAFTGSWNFSSNGVSGSGTNSYINTSFQQLTASLDSWSTNSSMGVYVRTNVTGGYDMGFDGTANSDYFLISRYTNDLSYFGAGGNITVSNTNATGFYVGTISGSVGNYKVLYKNGASIVSGTGTDTTNQTYNFLIGGVNSTGTPTEFSKKQYALAFIGKGLSSTDASNLNTIVQNFQTSLGRQI